MHWKSMAVGMAMAAAVLPAAARAAQPAPGAPGAVANWTAGDKDGFGTATATASKAWFTLDGGELTEVYAPDLGTPSVRDLQFVVTDGATFTERESDDADAARPSSPTRAASPTARSTPARSGRWRITKTYVDRSGPLGVLVDVHFESLTGRPSGSTCWPTRRCRAPATTTAARASATRWSPPTPRRASALVAAAGARRGSPAATWARATAGPTCAPTTGWTGPTTRRPPGNVVQTRRGCR